MRRRQNIYGDCTRLVPIIVCHLYTYQRNELASCRSCGHEMSSVAGARDGLRMLVEPTSEFATLDSLEHANLRFALDQGK